ncbi:hypothetical protein AXF42_Ash018395 [Apostasia shenzhenica]|uniref:Uncharacterized protein n=1 Tax=Apostasia shenzhenica TaxID=1088818 RepID=A0A2I0BEC1_9ASPA|nr:hypothetical protein AXF42_Ash018395 [Apostasia shenzhenica]
MVKVSTYFAMVFGAFIFWESMDRLHVWMALHQDEKVRFFLSLPLYLLLLASIAHVLVRAVCLLMLDPNTSFE